MTAYGLGPVHSFHMMAFAQIEEPFVATGALTAREYSSFLGLADRREALMLASRGRRPV